LSKRCQRIRWLGKLLRRNPPEIVALSPRRLGAWVFPPMFPPPKSPANHRFGALIAFYRIAKRKTALRTCSLRGIACHPSAWTRPPTPSESPANQDECAQGDSNSHGPNGPQGPEPCARPARSVRAPRIRTSDPGGWTIWTWWTGRLLSRCCHGSLSGHDALTYVIKRRTSVTRRTRPLMRGPRLDMSANTTGKEDGHE
jgi:hypothetical protein